MPGVAVTTLADVRKVTSHMDDSIPHDTPRNKRHRDAYAVRKAQNIPPPDELTCSKCGKSKHFTEFKKSPTHRHGRHSQCKQCVKEKRNIHRSNPEVKARKKEQDRAWVSANPERRSAIWHRYAQTDNGKDHCRLRVRTRKARIQSAQGKHTVEDIRNMYKRQKGKCYYCASKLSKTYHVDHIVPLTRGGSNDPSNLVIACPPCNLSKKDKLLHEWYQGGRLL